MNLVWSVRKSGLSLLTGCVGPAKPVAFIEDAAVRPAQLPDYVRGLQSIMRPLGLEASYYGHAATGLLHVRPVLDLHSPADLKKFRQVADQTSALVRQFKGSLSAEHGVGIARTEYMREQLGDELLDVMRADQTRVRSEKYFQSRERFSDDWRRLPQDRQSSCAKISLVRSSCRSSRACLRVQGPLVHRQSRAMQRLRRLPETDRHHVPDIYGDRRRIMSTRGRANIIRAAIELRVNGHDPLKSAELEAALSNCLSCKGCTPECPSNVNLALLKADLLYARWRRDGLPLRERILSNVDLLGQLGCAMPSIANRILDLKPARAVMEKTLGISAKRSLPHYANEQFDRWFARRVDATPRRAFEEQSGEAPLLQKKRGKVILWDDTFVRYHEPHIGIAAVKVLEALGFEVVLVKNRRCCGRPAFSQGNLDAAAKLGKHNVDLLNASASHVSRLTSHEPPPPILFLEPSCWSMFVEDYRELNIDGAEDLAKRCFLFEKFVDDLLAQEPEALRFNERPATVAIHPHCHAKSIMNPAFMATTCGTCRREEKQRCSIPPAAAWPARFGALAEKYDLSVQVAQRLLDKIDNQPPGTEIIASGTSCRHQITDLTNATREAHGRIARGSDCVIKARFGETPKPTREPRVLSRILPTRATPAAWVARPVLRLRRVSAAQRLQERRREDPRRGPPVCHAQRMTPDDWPVLCAEQQFVRP